MSEEINFKIDIADLFWSFNEHLSIKNNSRILFSGKFWIWKTCFLNEFFEKNKEYEVFHLFPVNYQISSNQNIINFLKYDILVELFKKDIDIFKKDNNEDIGMIDYIKENFNMNSFLENTIDLIEPISEIGKYLGKPIKILLNFDKKFQEFKKGDNWYLEKFLLKNNNETDRLSQILKKKIENIKGKKQSILVLDDLERIDPEHIFRILNIFSSHFDEDNNEFKNKFWFDKIILVADYQNIKSIFHHKYWKNTDFNWYLDKFFSIEVFQFKNEEIITNVVDKIIAEFKREAEINSLLEDKSYVKLLLKEILEKAINLTSKEKLNLRQLLKGINFQLNGLKNNSYIKNIYYNENKTRIQFINLTIKILISIFGWLKNDLLSVLKKIKLELKPQQNSDNETYIYESFAFDLYKAIIPDLKLTEEGSAKEWKNYTIWINNIKISMIQPAINNQRINNSKCLFFDLLIEYIEGSIN